MTANNPDQDDFDPALDEASDEFSYEEETFGDEESTEEESWDENAEEGDESADEVDEKPARKKKRGGLVSTLLIVAAVLAGVVVVYLKGFSGVSKEAAPAVVANVPETSTEQVLADAMAPAADPVIADAATSEVEQDIVAAEPLLPTPDEATLVAIPDIAPEIAPELAAPINVDQEPVEVASAPPMPAPIAAPEMALTSENSGDKGGFAAALPSAKDIMLTPAANTDLPDVTPSPVVAVEPVSAGLSDEATKGIEDKLSTLISKMDTFEGRIASLENGLHEISATTKADSSAGTAAVDISAAVTALEKKIAALERKVVTRSAPATPEEPTFVPAPAAPVLEEDASIVEAPVRKAMPNVEKARDVAPKVIADTPTPVKKAPVWVLRSAQPGVAMVAAASSGDMRSVKVGDSLTGLGRIVSIEQHGSRWVVQGTQGSLAN